jgi:hypothetical protein
MFSLALTVFVAWEVSTVYGILSLQNLLVFRLRDHRTWVARNDVIRNSPQVSFISDRTSVDADPCIALFDWIFPCSELFDVTGGELDIVDDFSTSAVESAQHPVASQHTDARAVSLESHEDIAEGLVMSSQHSIVTSCALCELTSSSSYAAGRP